MSKKVYEFEKNSQEKVMIEVSEYKGTPTVDFRVWFELNGKWIRTKKGLTIKPELLPELQKGIKKAEKVCKDLPEFSVEDAMQQLEKNWPDEWGKK